MTNHVEETAAALAAAYPAWKVWYVPRAAGRPAITWHAHRLGDDRHIIHADSADELAWEIEQLEG
jgi:hypothetical protein